MSTLPRATAVRFDEAQMWVDLEDGRTVGVPLVWYPRLLQGTPQQRADLFISPSGIHWETLNEDISIDGILAGRADMTSPARTAA